MIDSTRIEELKRRVQLDPASIAFAALAEEYRRAGEYEQAIAVCEAGLQRHPAYLSARVTLGRSLLELGRFDEARQQLEQVLKLAPENLAAIRALAEIHDRVGDYPDPAPRATTPQPPSRPVTAQAPGPGAAASPPTLFSRPAAANAPAASPPAAAPAPVAQSTLPPPPPAPPPRVPHPDEAALPALEAFLTAIRAARSSSRQPFE
jgi:tetratricopeptide (TPR) repeat protein